MNYYNYVAKMTKDNLIKVGAHFTPEVFVRTRGRGRGRRPGCERRI